MKIKDLRFLNNLFGKKIIHLETPHIHGEKLLKHLKKYRDCKVYCLTPINYDFVNVEFGLKLSKKQYQKFLIEYYSKLKKDCNLQLHVHLNQYPENLSNHQKEKMIKEAYSFFINQLKIKPTEIVFGWYASDKSSEDIAISLGLKIIRRHLHIYDRWIK